MGKWPKQRGFYDGAQEKAAINSKAIGLAAKSEGKKVAFQKS